MLAQRRGDFERGAHSKSGGAGSRGRGGVGDGICGCLVPLFARRPRGWAGGVDAGDFDVFSKLLAALDGVGIVVLNGGLENPGDLRCKVGALGTLFHDEALEAGGLEGAVNEQRAELKDVELDVGVWQLVELVHQVVVDAGSRIAVEIADREPAIEET